MAEMTIREMIDAQLQADELHRTYVKTAEEKKLATQAAKDHMQECLKAGDADGYQAALDLLTAAQAEEKKYADLADETGYFLYSDNEIGDAWTREREAFLAGDIKPHLTKIDTMVKNLISEFWTAWDLVQQHYDLADEARRQLMDGSAHTQAYACLPVLTREQLIDRINAANKRGSHP